jgi:hypothetical protein
MEHTDMLELRDENFAQVLLRFSDCHFGEGLQFINAMEQNEIRPRTKRWSSKIFQTLLPNFIDGFGRNFIHFACRKMGALIGGPILRRQGSQRWLS